MKNLSAYTKLAYLGTLLGVLSFATHAQADAFSLGVSYSNGYGYGPLGYGAGAQSLGAIGMYGGAAAYGPTSMYGSSGCGCSSGGGALVPSLPAMPIGPVGPVIAQQPMMIAQPIYVQQQPIYQQPMYAPQAMPMPMPQVSPYAPGGYGMQLPVPTPMLPPPAPFIPPHLQGNAGYGPGFASYPNAGYPVAGATCGVVCGAGLQPVQVMAVPGGPVLANNCAASAVPQAPISSGYVNAASSGSGVTVIDLGEHNAWDTDDSSSTWAVALGLGMQATNVYPVAVPSQQSVIPTDLGFYSTGDRTSDLIARPH